MQRTIQSIVNYAVRVAEPEEVILFGSMATGTNRIESDVDLLVVTGNDFARQQIVKRVEEYARELSLEADVLVFSQAALQKELESPHSFLATVYRHGNVLYRKQKKSLAS